MRQSRFTETQIIGMIKEQEAGISRWRWIWRRWLRRGKEPV